MTLPIAFTPTPADVGTDNADAEDAFTQVATVTNANFAKVNTYLRAQIPVFGQTVQTGTITTGTAGVWVTVGANWPALAITLPARVQSVMITIGATMDSWSALNFIGASFELTGATSIPSGRQDERRILVQDGRIETSRTLTYPGSSFTGGGVLTVTPQYMIYPSLVDGLALVQGSLQVIAFAG